MNAFRIALLGAAALAAACGQNRGTETEAADRGPRLAEPLVIEGFSTPESAVYDPVGDRYLIANVGAFGPANDGFISAVAPDGTVQNLRLIEGTDDAPLANALGTAVHDNHLYVADSPYVRVFDLATGEQTAAYMIEGAGFLNDLEVAEDGAVFVTDMGSEDPASWAVVQIAPDGTISDFARGEELQRPNGIELDDQGRVVVAAVASPLLVFFSRDTGEIDQTITLPDGGYDGIVLLDNGYVVSDPFGHTIYRVGFDGQSAEIGGGVQSAASLGYDHTRRRLLIPQLQRNTVTLMDLD